MLRFRYIGLFCVFAASFLAQCISAQEDSGLPPVPTIVQIVPAPGETLPELLTIEVQFDRAVTGLDAADLLINSQPATDVSEVLLGQFVFTVPRPADGAIEVKWRSDHGIVDETGAAFGGGSWSYTLNSNLPPQVIISEFMASNKRTLRDSDGESSDWIELFNPADDEVNIEGWSLSASANLQEWQFPAVSIPAKGFLVVFASGKDRRDPSLELHTHFKLSEKGQFLALVSPQGETVSAFAPGYPPQTVDISYGRAQGSPESVGFLSKPTPGAPNATSGAGFTSPVEFSALTGIYTNTFLLTLHTTDTNALIRYTLNGALPTNSSPVYLDPILITNTTVVRARAFQDRLLPGPVRTENYAFFSNLVNFTSTLPIVIIQTIGRGPVATVQTTSEFSLFPPRNGVATLTNPAALTMRAGIHLRGSSTLGLPKGSYSLELWDEFNNAQDVSLLGMPAESDWVLYGPNQYEPIMIHNPFIYQLSREIGQYSSRTRFVEVFLQSKNGLIISNNYNGIYVLEEKIKVGQDRVNIDKLRPQNITPPTITGGYLLKVDRTGPGESGLGGGLVYVDPKEKDVRQPARKPQDTYIRNYLTAFGKSLSAPTFRDPQIGFRAFIDEQSWIDYHLLEVLSGNVDSLVLSCYFHKPREGPFTFGPHWDFDRALGSTDGRDNNPRVWATGPFFTATWWNKMFTDKDFWQHWVDRWQELRITTLSRDHLNHVIDTLSGQLREAQPRETKKWHIPLRGGSTYQGEIDLMKNWLSNRIDFIDKQLTQPVLASVPSGQVLAGTVVTLQAQPAATIYYTLDGTDPRLPQGDLSPAALTYTAPFAIDRNVQLFARARNLLQRQTGIPSTTPWSAPTAGAYFLTRPRLLVSEISFHPIAPAAVTNNPSDYEFIELKNPGPETVDLNQMVLSGGVRFTFGTNTAATVLKPGERLLLVKNADAFQKSYPAAVIGGQYTGSLANSGDHLTLRGPMGEPIFDFTFKDSWQPLADGLGFTLVLADEAISPDALGEPFSWRASSRPGGSPGFADPAAASAQPIQITEALSNAQNGGSDKVELYNPSNGEVDLSGWFLTDDPHAPFKYKIPDGTHLASRSFLVLSDAQFNSGDTGFGLNAGGDAIYLFAADKTGQLTGYMHGFPFGAADPGQSFGLFTTSDGLPHFVPQQQTTFGLPNSEAAVGPVVLSEIMYAAQPKSENDQGEYIELQNLSNSPVTLSDPANPASTWRLRGGIQYDFPPDTILAPHESIVVTPINPANQFFANQFRSRYGLTPDTRLFGPWTGTLANKGDSVELQRPVKTSAPTPNPNYTEVDAVHYTSHAPWPELNSPRFSISRIRPGSFGDDPANWTTTLPTPARQDSDGDGLPDWWEIQNGLDPHSALGDNGTLGDPDGDGFPNYQEFLAGTGPHDPNDFLFLTQTVTTREVLLNFLPLIGRSYTVYYTDDLSSEIWHPLRNYSLITDTTPISVHELPLKPSRFYKLQIP
jgi:hypothetical protein